MRISDWSSDVCSSDLAVRTRSPTPDRLHRFSREAGQVMLRYGLAALGLVALSAGIAFHQPATAAGESPKIKASAHLSDTSCAKCPGVTRNGKGVNVVGLTVPPRNQRGKIAMSSLPREQLR